MDGVDKQVRILGLINVKISSSRLKWEVQLDLFLVFSPPLPRVEPRDHVEHDVQPRGGARLWDGTVREAILVVPQDAEDWIHLRV